MVGAMVASKTVFLEPMVGPHVIVEAMVFSETLIEAPETSKSGLETVIGTDALMLDLRASEVVSETRIVEELMVITEAMLKAVVGTDIVVEDVIISEAVLGGCSNEYCGYRCFRRTQSDLRSLNGDDSGPSR